MRRSWLVLPLLLTFAAGLFARDAHAIEPRRCACPQRIVLPSLGETNVPLNTKLWVLDHSGAPGSGSTNLNVSTVEGVAPGTLLAPNTEYAPEGTRFTTGSEPDTTPPAAPAEVSVSILAMSQPAEYMPIDSMMLYGIYDDDTALVRVDLFDGRRASTFYTTPSRLYVCAPGVSIAPGKIRVTVTALDLAGNASPPFTTEVTAEVGTGGPTITSDDCGERPRGAGLRPEHFRCGNGSMALLLLIPVLAIGLLIGIVVVQLIRNARIRRTPPVEVGLLVAEAVVRMMLRGHLVASALGSVAIGVSLAFGSDGLALALAVIPFMGLSHALSCKLALRRLEHQGASAERRDTWLIVSDVSGKTRIRANERIFRGAVRAVLPAASIEKE